MITQYKNDKLLLIPVTQKEVIFCKELSDKINTSGQWFFRDNLKARSMKDRKKTLGYIIEWE